MLPRMHIIDFSPRTLQENTARLSGGGNQVVHLILLVGKCRGEQMFDQQI